MMVICWILPEETQCWVELCLSPKDIGVLTLVPMNVTLFGNRVFADATKSRWVMRVGPPPTGLVSLENEGNLDTDTHTQKMRCDHTHTREDAR